MSFLPDLAGWALSGGAGRESDNNDGDVNNNTDMPAVEQESEEEIRAKRIARLSARFGNNNQQQQTEAMQVDGSSTGVATPMEVDSASSPKKSPEPEKVAVVGTREKITPVAVAIETNSGTSDKTSQMELEEAPKKKRAKEPAVKADPARKTQRKKELLLKKTLKIKLAGGSISDSECIEINIGTAILTVENIAEVLASRLAVSPKSLSYSSSSEKGLFAYLGMCHKRASEELKNMPSNPVDSTVTNELKDILNEMKRQLVSFAASSLMVPDLFELAKDGPAQIAQCLANATLDPASSITIGVAGKNSSFFCALCDELLSQDADAFETVVTDIVKDIVEDLSQCETVLDSSGSGLVQVSALNALCSYKKAAIIVAKTPNFLLPKEGTAQAAERVAVPIPPPPPGATPQQQQIYRMMTSMAQGRQSYLRRSGPALEKETLLGLVLRIGTPMDNKAVSSQFQGVARRSRSDVKNITDGLRRQLRIYQDAVHNFVRSLITSGEEARKPVSKPRGVVL